MEVDDNNTDIDSKKQIVSPIKLPGPSTIIAPEEDSGYENMDVDEPKDCNFQESIRRKRPLEVVSCIQFQNKIILIILYMSQNPPRQDINFEVALRVLGVTFNESNKESMFLPDTAAHTMENGRINNVIKVPVRKIIHI